MKDEVRELLIVAVRRWDSWTPGMNEEGALPAEIEKENELAYNIFVKMSVEEVDEFIHEFLRALKPESKDNYIRAVLKTNWMNVKRLRNE